MQVRHQKACILDMDVDICLQGLQQQLAVVMIGVLWKSSSLL